MLSRRWRAYQFVSAATIALLAGCQSSPGEHGGAACPFGSGAKVTETLPISEIERAAIPIKHVIVLMKENRSFDHLLGNLHDSGQLDTEAIPAAFTNNDRAGQAVSP